MMVSRASCAGQFFLPLVQVRSASERGQGEVCLRHSPRSILRRVERGSIHQARGKYIWKSKLEQGFGNKFLENCLGLECFFKKRRFSIGSLSFFYSPIAERISLCFPFIALRHVTSPNNPLPSGVCQTLDSLVKKTVRADRVLSGGLDSTDFPLGLTLKAISHASNSIRCPGDPGSPGCFPQSNGGTVFAS